MSAFDELHKAIVMEVPEAAGPFIYTALARVGREFCDRTHVWRADPVTLDMTAGTNEIALTIPASSQIVAIEYLTVEGFPVDPATEREIEQYDVKWREKSGDPQYFIHLMQEDKIQLYPNPNRTIVDGIEYRITLKPTIAARTLPEFLCQQYDEVIRQGVLYELLHMPNRPWTDVQHAMIHRDRYQKMLYDVRGKILTRHAAVNHGTMSGTIA